MADDPIVKGTHLPTAEMEVLLKRLGPDRVREALVAWAKGERPKNFGKFRRAWGWVILDEAENEYPHRPVVSLACEKAGERVMDPNNFGLHHDNVCKEWMEDAGFRIDAPRAASTQ